MLLTVKEASSYLKMHQNTVYDWAREGKLPSIKLNGQVRFDQDDLDKFINSNKRQAFNPYPLPIQTGISLEGYDKLYLKGGRTMSAGKRNRWQYSFGTIYVRESKKGNRWYIDYSSRGRRTREAVKNATCRAEALLALKKKVTESFDSQYATTRRPEIMSFIALAEKYLEDYAKPKKRSWKTDKAYIEANMKPFFGDMLITAIGPLDGERYIKSRLQSGVSQITVNRCFQILRRMLNLAVDWGFLASNPFQKIRLFSEKENQKERILMLDEEEKLLFACSEHLRPVVILALNTGLRRGEILALKWACVDFNAGVLKVERSKGGKPRFVDINSVLADLLKPLRNAHPEAEYVFVNAKTGRPFVEIGKAFRNACRRAKIKGFRFHDLRHTFASRLIEAGVDIITVRDLLGHSSVKLTERYTHSKNEQKKRAVELLVGKKPENSAQIGHNSKDQETTDNVIPLYPAN